MTTSQLAAATGTFSIAGKAVARLGFGTMRLIGRGIWGEPADRVECVATLRRAVELGVQLIDTADSYGPHIAEQIVREALHPYPEELLIATKVGLTRNGPDVIDTPNGPKRLGPAAWPPVGRPEYLRQQALMSMRRLGVDHLDLLQLHRIDPQVPLADQVGELKAMHDEGKIAAIGLSQVTVEQIGQAQAIAEIATVQNRYNLVDRDALSVLEYCAAEGIGFIPWAPMAQGASLGDAVEKIAQAHDATPNQVALAWLLARSPVTLPIPGTSSVSHLEDNLRGGHLTLDDGELQTLSAAA